MRLCLGNERAELLCTEGEEQEVVPVVLALLRGCVMNIHIPILCSRLGREIIGRDRSSQASEPSMQTW